MFSANYIDQSIATFMRLKEGETTLAILKNTAMCLKNLIWLVEIITQYANTKFTWTRPVMGSYQIPYVIE